MGLVCAAPDMGNYRRDCRKAVAGSISVNRDLTTLALVRLVTSASVFWTVLQLVGCRCRPGFATVYVLKETPRYTASVEIAWRICRTPVRSPHYERRKLAFRRREADLVARYNDRHPLVVNIRAEHNDVKRAIAASAG